jgi:hypothetical protein
VIKEKTAMNRNSSGRRYDREFKNKGFPEAITTVFPASVQTC